MATLRVTCLTGGRTPCSAATGIPGRRAHVLVSYVRCPCRADEGVSGHTVVRCTTDGCCSAWYRPRHYPPGTAPSRDTGISDPRTWLGDRTRSGSTVGSQVGSHRQSTQSDSESTEVFDNRHLSVIQLLWPK
jgi:hypothetical protein